MPRVQQTREYLAGKYGLCAETITKLLREKCGITHRGHLTPMDLSIFVEKVGTPEQFRRTVELLKDSSSR
jgi:hypothetical protein